MELFPAIDLSGGKVVRLTQGDYDKVEVYARDPAAVAREFTGKGVRNLHVVDLDGAKSGELVNFPAVQAIAEAGGLFLQIGGGIRDEERIRRYLELGAGRVILGTAAVERFDFLREMVAKYGDKIAVSVDARDGRIAVRGWREVTETDSLEFCKRLDKAGVSTIIYTDISKDGVLGGTNLEAYRNLSGAVGCNIIASGGISYAEEIVSLKEMGIYGAIVGKAIYAGKLDLEGVLRLC